MLCNYTLNARENLILQYSSQTDSIPENILILTSFNAMSVQARGNKRELFAVLADSLKNYLARNIKEQTGYKTIIISGILPGETDSLIYPIISDNKATKAILIRSLDVHFEEADVKESTDSEGETRIITSYDLCANIEYTIYDKDRIIISRPSTIENCEFFTTRSVKDGKFVLRFPPDIVGKKKHTYKIVEKNAEKYVSKISPQLLNSF